MPIADVSAFFRPAAKSICAFATMSSLKSFVKFFSRKAIQAKDANAVHASRCVDARPDLLQHFANQTWLKFKPAAESATQTATSDLLTGCKLFQFRGLHASLQAYQMSQQEADSAEATASSESNGAGMSSEDTVPQEEKLQGDKPEDTTKGVLAPVVPGMPVVHRGTQGPSQVVGLSLTIHGLIKEMADRIRRRLFEEAIQIYREWLQCIDPVTGKPNKPLVTPCNIALLAEGLKGAPVDVLLKRVDEMGRLGVSPNTDTFYILFNVAADGKDTATIDRLFNIVQDLGIPVQTEWCIKAITMLRSHSDVWKAMDYVRIMVTNNLSPDDMTLTQLVMSFSRIGQAQKATDLVRWGQKRDAFPSMNALGDLLQACVESDVSEGALLALELLFGRRRGRPARNISLDEGSLLAVLSLAARTGDITLSTKAWEVLLISLKQSAPPSEACFLARLHAATTGGDLDLAISTLQAMEKEYASAINTEVFSPFTSLRPFVLGVARGGSATLDTTYFKLEVLASGYQVPLSAINCIILGCSNTWDIDRAYQTFEAIRSVFGLMPNVHSCNALIEGFAKMRKVPETLKVYEFMIGSGLHPDQRTFDLLIKGHIVNRDTKTAMEIVNQMMDAGFSLHKELAVKLRRRFVRECDDQGAQSIFSFTKKFNYADGFTGDARKAILFPFSFASPTAGR